MSIKFKLERAFHNLLGPAADERNLQILTSQVVGSQTKRPRRVIIIANTAQQVTPKSRNLRFNVIVVVERTADDDVPPDDPDPDEETPPINHARNVDAIHEALDNQPEGLAALLSAQREDPLVAGFTCFGVRPIGEVHEPPHMAERCLRDVWGYTCTVIEADCT